MDTVIQYIGKFMLTLVIELYDYDTCKEMFENLYLICNKHGLSEINKTMSALHLYYDLLSQRDNEDVYKRFSSLNSSDKSEPIKMLKMCYDVHKGKIQIDDNTLAMINKKPEFALLFCEPRNKPMLILGIDNKSLVSMPNIFDIYSSILEESQWDEENLLKIASHL